MPPSPRTRTTAYFWSMIVPEGSGPRRPTSGAPIGGPATGGGTGGAAGAAGAAIGSTEPVSGLPGTVPCGASPTPQSPQNTALSGQLDPHLGQLTTRRFAFALRENDQVQWPARS